MIRIDIATCGANGKIDVRFPYSKRDTGRIKKVAGRQYKPNPGDRHWHVPLDMEACRSLRRSFGSDLMIGTALRQWAEAAKREEDKLGSIAHSMTGELTVLWDKLPTLARAIHLGPLGMFMSDEEIEEALKGPGSYQAADTEFVSISPSAGVFNEQGTGKTPTYIAAIWEAGLEYGSHLVVAPKGAIGGTWLRELERWTADSQEEVGIFACMDSRGSREETIRQFENSTAPIKWLIVNPAMFTYVKDPTRTSKVIVTITSQKKGLDGCFCNKRKDTHEHYVSPYPVLQSVVWRTMCIDEAHKGSIRNHRTLTAKAMKAVKVDPNGKRTVMTGTPMKKRGGSDIWGILNWLRPDVFTSYWRFAGDFFEVEENEYGKRVHELLPERETDFWKTLTPFALRRLKKEVAPWLPEKLYVPVDCFMSGRQYKQYSTYEKEGAVELSDGSLIEQKGVLDKFVRLGQFANAYCEPDEQGRMIPVESCKYDVLIEKMDEAGMFDEGETRKQLIFSRSRRVIEFVAAKLKEIGLIVDVIYGGNMKQRASIIDNFQNGPTRVLCIVTTAGGVSITLDAADEVHLLDEMWSPDEDEQAEDRAHRVSRIHQVTVFIYRSVGTVDQYIAETKEEKKDAHSIILDVRRKIVEKWYSK